MLVPGAFPGGKGGRCVRLTNLLPSCAVFMRSENLNFLEPSGPLQACNGTALPLIVVVVVVVKGKAVPLQAWTGPECSQEVKFPTFRDYGAGWWLVVSLTHRPSLPPGNTVVKFCVEGYKHCTFHETRSFFFF